MEPGQMFPMHIGQVTEKPMTLYINTKMTSHWLFTLHSTASNPHNGQWYAIGTISMYRPKQAEGFRCISIKVCRSWQLSMYKKPTTLHTYELIDFLLSILTHQSLTIPGVLGLSHLLPSLPLFPMLHTCLWSSLRSFPIPWPCLLSFHCKSSFHILFYTAYFCLLTVTLPICCLVVISRALAFILPIIETPSHIIKDIPPLFIKKQEVLPHSYHLI
jgi:hypothetical protein